MFYSNSAIGWADLESLLASIFFTLEAMPADVERILEEVRVIASSFGERKEVFQRIADFLRKTGNYRWVGLYDVDHAVGLVKNIVWSGPEAPSYPIFPLTKGLTGSAISFRRTVNIGDVAADPRYLTALGSTRSEIIVPVFDSGKEKVIGTIDVESERENAFNAKTQSVLELVSDALRLLWSH
ncbi:MAG TPA: GAF domain-containing protein [Candidatus Acidoferrum sp.]|nr:GAF domain-containing protein [Candidatus Acidoferrum sp.]